MSESMVTIPLKEYEELRQAKESVKSKSFSVVKYGYGESLTFYTESKFAEFLVSKMAESYTRIGLLEKSNSNLLDEKETLNDKIRKRSKKKWYQFCK